MTRLPTRRRSGRSRSMSSSQHLALSSVDVGGRFTVTDQRIIDALLRRGWAQEHVKQRGRRRPQRWWTITDAGRQALATMPVVSRPRPVWRNAWTRIVTAPGRQYLVEEHGLVRPGHHMLWRLRCPAVTAADPDTTDTVPPVDALEFDEEAMPPIAYRETLAEIIELLAEHLCDPRRACAHRHRQPTTDLDAIV